MQNTRAPTELERVRGLPADPLPGADQHEPAAVEPQQPGEVGDRGVVDARHDAATVRSASISRLRSSGMTSVPSSSRFRMIDSCDRCPNCT